MKPVDGESVVKSQHVKSILHSCPRTRQQWPWCCNGWCQSVLVRFSFNIWFVTQNIVGPTTIVYLSTSNLYSCRFVQHAISQAASMGAYLRRIPSTSCPTFRREMALLPEFQTQTKYFIRCHSCIQRQINQYIFFWIQFLHACLIKFRLLLALYTSVNWMIRPFKSYAQVFAQKIRYLSGVCSIDL